MKSAVRPWRDPAFFGFMLFGVALLCSSVLCLAQASTQPRIAQAARPVAAAGPFVRPSRYLAAPDVVPSRPQSSDGMALTLSF